MRNALPACRELGIHTVLMAFDMDMYENPAVANCFVALVFFRLVLADLEAQYPARAVPFRHDDPGTPGVQRPPLPLIQIEAGNALQGAAPREENQNGL